MTTRRPDASGCRCSNQFLHIWPTGSAGAAPSYTPRHGLPARGSRAAAFRAVAAQPGLRRVEIGWAGVVTGESIAQIAIGVLAYNVAGIGGLGLLVALQMLPSALLAPMLATLGDRFRRERLMLGCDGARLVIALAAAIAADRTRARRCATPSRSGSRSRRARSIRRSARSCRCSSRRRPS